MSVAQFFPLAVLVSRVDDQLAAQSPNPALQTKVSFYPIPARITGHVLDALLQAGYVQADDGSLAHGYFTDLRKFHAHIDVLEVTPEN